VDWFEQFYAEAMRYGISRQQAEAMLSSGEVTQGNVAQVLRGIENRTAPGYSVYQQQFEAARQEAIGAKVPGAYDLAPEDQCSLAAFLLTLKQGGA